MRLTFSETHQRRQAPVLPHQVKPERWVDAAMKHSSSRILFAYWDALRGERAAPDRGDIEPGAIRHILADTFILEKGLGGSMRFRLAGTRLCSLLGHTLKDQDFASLWPVRGGRDINRLLDCVMDDAAGIVAGIHASTPSGRDLDMELLLLPLRYRGKTHARMLGALSALSLPCWVGLETIDILSLVSVRVIWPSGRQPTSPEHEATNAGKRRQFIVYRGGKS